METKSKFIVDFFSCRDIFSPRKLDFVAISKNFRRSNNRMKNRSFNLIADMMKSFANLIFFDFDLIFVLDREPFTTSVDLDRRIESLFERRFFDDIYYLSFDEA
jgi:hypothetical protein